MGAKKSLEIEEVEVMGPKEGEVLLKVIALGVCHTEAFTLSGMILKLAFLRAFDLMHKGESIRSVIIF